MDDVYNIMAVSLRRSDNIPDRFRQKPINKWSLYSRNGGNRDGARKKKVGTGTRPVKLELEKMSCLLTARDSKLVA